MDMPGGFPNFDDIKPKPDQEQPWRAIPLPSFESIPVPERRWIVPNWLPVRVVTLCYADGGIGKTLLGLQLMASTALNSKWCGIRVTPCNSIGLFSEDDATELHIRMDAIRQHHGVSWADLGNMHPADATGQDNILVRFNSYDGKMTLTPRFDQLREQAMDTKSRLIVIDTAATCFSGNESDRGQVTQFVGNALTKLAQDIDGAVLLNAHPSLSGLASGDLRSGSTAWNNSCRSRWGLARPEDAEGKPILDSPERILTRRKANAASTGDAITMEWRDGVFLVPEKYTAGIGSRKDQAEQSFLAALQARKRDGLHVSPNTRAGNFAPKVLHTTPEARDFSVKELAEAMNNLLKRGCVRTQVYEHDYKTHEELVAV
jgi:RecA-family ATPase